MRALACLLALAAGPLTAQTTSPWSGQAGGYFKNLASASRSYFTNQAWGDDMSRLRLSLDGRYRDWLLVHVDYDNEVHAGNFTEQPDFAVVSGRQDAAWLDLQHAFIRDRNAYWDTSVYRGYLSLRGAGGTLTLGRQRIGWGTARFWSPMDMFNPISPLAIEPDERQGVDAALGEFHSSGSLRWNAVYAPQNGFRRSTSAVRLSRTIHNTDFDAAAARIGRDWTAGFDFAGQVAGAGLRGELTYRWRSPASQSVSTRDALRLTAGADYAFSGGLYLVGEYFYNQGQPDRPFGVDALLRYSSEIFTLRRHFLSAGATYPITPLWKVESYVVADITGPSAVILPRLTHSLTANADLAAGAQLFAASRSSEFAGLSNLAFVEFTFHFR